jgi:competence protein ComEA
MWKNFFYFSKGQRIGIIVLLVLIFLTLLAIWFVSQYNTAGNISPNTFLNEAKQFESSLKSRDSLRLAAWKNKYKQYEKDSNFNQTPYSKKTNEYTLFEFDPNTLDSAGFIRLGIKPFIASNIIKFRKKGGRFENPERFSKVYGLLPEKFKELEPYIRIGAKPTTKVDSTLSRQQSKKIENIRVELNSADTTELMQVKGIGRGYAKSIVRFRTQMGGFVKVDQLRELYGMTDANFEKIKPSCTINLTLVRQIKVNTASVERLDAHPYLNFYESKAIYEYRRKKGKILSIAELKSIPDIRPETIEKISPYLSFE